MAKKTLSQESCADFRPYKRVRISTAIGASNSDDDDEGTASSVGSNQLIRELILLSDDDDDDDEVESPLSSNMDEIKSEITGFRSAAVVGEIGLSAEEEQRNWLAKYGSMIVDGNGFLLGQFRRLDEELSLV